MLYDPREATEKFSFDQTMKRTLPFKRAKINYATFHRKIESKNLKKPVEIMKGKDLRRYINKEDGGMILGKILNNMYAKQIKEW